MDEHSQLSLLRLFKFLALGVYAFGVGVGLGRFDPHIRKPAVHGVASAALIIVWLCGYGLTFYTGVRLTELWISLGWLASLLAHLLLGRLARMDLISPGGRAGVILCLVATCAFMVFRPTWSGLKP